MDFDPNRPFRVAGIDGSTSTVDPSPPAQTPAQPPGQTNPEPDQPKDQDEFDPNRPFRVQSDFDTSKPFRVQAPEFPSFEDWLTTKNADPLRSWGAFKADPLTGVARAVEKGATAAGEFGVSAAKGLWNMGRHQWDSVASGSFGEGALQNATIIPKIFFHAGESLSDRLIVPNMVGAKLTPEENQKRIDLQNYERDKAAYEASQRGEKGTVIGAIAKGMFGDDYAREVESNINPDTVNAAMLFDPVLSGESLVKNLATRGAIRTASAAVEDGMKMGEAATKAGSTIEKGVGMASKVAGKVQGAVDAVESTIKALPATTRMIVERGWDIGRNIPHLGEPLRWIDSGLKAVKGIGKAAPFIPPISQAVKEGAVPGYSVAQRAALAAESPAIANAILKAAPVINAGVGAARVVGGTVKRAAVGAATGAVAGGIESGNLEGAAEGAGMGAVANPFVHAAMYPLTGGMRASEMQSRNVSQWVARKPPEERAAIRNWVNSTNAPLGDVSKMAEMDTMLSGYQNKTGGDVQVAFDTPENYAKNFVKPNMTPEEAATAQKQSATQGVMTVNDPITGKPVVHINLGANDAGGTTFHEALHALFKLAPPESEAGQTYANAKTKLINSIRGYQAPDGSWIVAPEYSAKELSDAYDRYASKLYPERMVDGQLAPNPDRVRFDSGKVNADGTLTDVGVNSVAEEMLAEHMVDFAKRAKGSVMDTARNVAKVGEGNPDRVQKFFSQREDSANQGVMGMLKSFLGSVGVFFRGDEPVTADGKPVDTQAKLFDLKDSPVINQLLGEYLTAKSKVTQRMLGLDTDGNPRKIVIGPKDVLGPGNRKILPYIVESGMIQTTTDENGNVQPVFDAKGNPILLTRSQFKDLDTSRQKVLSEALKAAPPPEDPNAVNPHLESEEGAPRLSGRYLDDAQMEKVKELPSNLFPRTLKSRLKLINDKLRENTGQSLILDYNAATHGGGSRYQALERSARLVNPIGIQVTRQGNVNMLLFDTGTFNGWLSKQKPKTFDLWKGDERLLWDNIKQYNANHADGLPGWTKLDQNEALAKQKADRINAIMGIRNAETDPIANNPERDRFSGNKFIRTFRLDRISGLREVQSDFPFTIDYGKHLRNFRPDIQAQVETPAFHNWFGESQVVDESGKPLVVYHGTSRGDRVDAKFRKVRATSGPMPFFTENPDIASKYSTAKSDNSLEHPDSYAGWFRYKGKGMRSSVPIDNAWWHLSHEERSKITENLYKVGYENPDEQTGAIVGNSHSIMGQDTIDWHLQDNRGNALKTLVDIWLDSGSLIHSEHEFLDVLKGAGMDMSKVQFDDPHRSQSAVYPVFLSIRSPLDASKIPPDVISALDNAGKRKRGGRPVGGNPDLWDKGSISGQAWLDSLHEDQKNGTTHAWTRIPDWVTETLKKFGYDGVKDRGGKYSDVPGHTVWVPFEETQVKSAVGNRGTFDSENPNILFRPNQEEELTSERSTFHNVPRDAQMAPTSSSDGQALQMRAAASSVHPPVPGMPQSANAGVAQNPPTEGAGSSQGGRSQLRQGVPATGQASPSALSGVRQPFFGKAPSGLQSAAERGLALSQVPPRLAPPPALHSGGRGGAAEGSPDLQRAADDLLRKPVLETYQKRVKTLGWKDPGPLNPMSFRPASDEMGNRQQAVWLDQQAKAAGYRGGINELVLDPEGGKVATDLMKQWRAFHVDSHPEKAHSQVDETLGIRPQESPETARTGGRGRGPIDPLDDAANVTAGIPGASQRIAPGEGNGRVAVSQRYQQLDQASEPALVDWAKSSGRLISDLPEDWEFRGTKDAGENEHHVFFDERSDRVVKMPINGIPKNPEFTDQWREKGKDVDGWVIQPGGLAKYLQRLRTQNEVFGDDIRLHGIYQDKHGAVYPVISQPKVKGNVLGEADRPRIEKAFRDRGFVPLGDDSYYRKKDNAFVADAHPGNLLDVKGTLVPFDVMVTHPEGELKDFLEGEIFSKTVQKARVSLFRPSSLSTTGPGLAHVGAPGMPIGRVPALAGATVAGRRDQY